MKDDIIRIVCQNTGISVEAMKQKMPWGKLSRKREIVLARQLCYYFLRKYTDLSLKKLGEIFEYQDHTTVMHAIHLIDDLALYDHKIKSMMNSITDHIKAILIPNEHEWEPQVVSGIALEYEKARQNISR